MLTQTNHPTIRPSYLVLYASYRSIKKKNCEKRLEVSPLFSACYLLRGQCPPHLVILYSSITLVHKFYRDCVMRLNLSFKLLNTNLLPKVLSSVEKEKSCTQFQDHGVYMVFRTTGSFITDLSTILTISGSRNRTILMISGSRKRVIHFYDFWIQKSSIWSTDPLCQFLPSQHLLRLHHHFPQILL